jgi:DNA-directed RNA polymerase specialized sigma24 family protein
MSTPQYDYSFSSRYIEPDYRVSPPVTFTYDRLGSVLTQPEDQIEHLFRYYTYKVRAMLQEKLGHLLSTEDREDAIQAAICSMLQESRQPGFKPKDFLEWYKHHAKCRASDILRVRMRQAEMEVQKSLDWLDCQEGASGAGMNALESTEFRKLVDHVVAEMPKHQGQVWRTFVIRYLDLPERAMFAALTGHVSADTGRPENEATVKSQWHRGSGPLRDGLRHSGYGPEQGDN